MTQRQFPCAWMILPAFGCALTAPHARAQDEASQSVALYFLALGIDGRVAAGDASASIDADSADFFDQLEWGGMGSYRYQRESWSLQVDVIYATLAGDAPAGPRAELEQAMIEVDGGYRFNDVFEIVAGARAWDYQIEINALTPGGAPASRSASWTDPLIGARCSVPLGDAWEVTLRADVGGFGVGSDFAWHATAGIGWHGSDTFSVLAGFRVFDVDFDSDDAGGARVDLRVQGPALGAAVRF
jgi:hypothetical protein